MELFAYLLKVSACTTLFFGFYLFVLRRLTFFSANRFFLLVTLVLSFVIPTLKLTIERDLEDLPVFENSQTPVQLESASGFTDDIEVVHLDPNLKVEEKVNWEQIITYAYLFVVAVSLLLIVWRLVKLWRLAQKGYERIDGLRIVESKDDLSNCSFFNYVFINEQSLSTTTREILLKHEAVHARKLHSVDKLFLLLAKSALWFNPIIYFYEMALEQTHEYEADEATSGVFGNQTYAKLLLQLASGSGQIPLTHNFVKNPVKERIEMLFKTKSKNMKKLTYLFALPLMVAIFTVFAVEIVYAQKQDSKKMNDEPKTKIKELALPIRPKLTIDSIAFNARKKRVADMTGKTFSGIIGTDYMPIKGNVTLAGKFFKVGKETFILSKFMEVNYPVLKENDQITIETYGVVIDSKDPYIKVIAKTIKKNGVTLYKRPSPVKHAFLFEANQVRFTDPVVTYSTKTPNGTILKLTRNGYNFTVKFDESQMDNDDYLKDLTPGDTVMLRFVNEAKTGLKSYDITDWVSISKDISTFGLQNKTLFPKFYNRDGSQKLNRSPVVNTVNETEVATPIIRSSASAIIDNKNDISYLKKGIVQIGRVSLQAEDITFERKKGLITARQAKMMGEDGVEVASELIIYDSKTGEFTVSKSRSNGLQTGSKSSEFGPGLKYYAQDSVRVSKLAETYSLYGAAHVEFGNYKLQGDLIEVNLKSKMISALGATLTDPDSKTVKEDLIRFNLTTKTYTDWKKFK